MTPDLWGILDQYLPKLDNGTIRATTIRTIKQQAARARTAATNAQALIESINVDGRLSPAGKREQAQVVNASANAEATAAQESIIKALRAERETHERTAAWPRSTGTDADREARLSNARTDVETLMRNTKPGERADRLAFAIRNGTEAMRELVLGEKYPERILWPSTPDSQVDAVTWANARQHLLAEYHPGGQPARDALQALATLNTTGNQIETIITHAVAGTQ